MTGFEITLISLIIYTIIWIFLLKNWDYGKLPKGFGEWLLAFLCSICISFLVFLACNIIYFTISILCQVNWHDYFTKDLF